LRQNKVILSISPLLKADSDFSSRYVPGVLTDFTTSGGQVWAFPFQATPNSIVYYNADIFHKAGIESFPATLSEFFADVTKLRAAGYIPIAAGDKGLYVVPSLILNSMVYRYGNSDWFYSVYDNKGGSFADPAFANAAKGVETLVKENACPSDVNSISEQQEWQIYFQGKAAMFIAGGWALEPVIDNAPDAILKATKVALMPQVKGMKQNADIVPGGAGWGVSVNSQTDAATQKAAIAVAKGMFGQDFANISAQHDGLPAMKPTIDMSKMPALYQEYENLPLKFAPVIDVWFPAPFVTVYYNAMQDLLTGSITADNYVQQVESAWQSWQKANQ
jgi:raffinose/stachyose/melibiose transport system substrate-binding protein